MSSELERRTLRWILDAGLGDPKRILLTIPVLHSGWEMDTEAWIVEMEDGRRVGVTTSHGSMIEASQEWITEKISEAYSSLRALWKSIDLLSFGEGSPDAKYPTRLLMAIHQRDDARDRYQWILSRVETMQAEETKETPFGVDVVGVKSSCPETPDNAPPTPTPSSPPDPAEWKS